MESFVSDAVDHKGNPADRTKTGGWVSAALILGIELCERLSTMAIVANLVTYLVGTMHLPSSTSSNFTTNYGGTGYILCLIGGIAADSFLGRYWTIAVFGTIGSLGTCILSISTAIPHLRPPRCNPALSTACQEANNLQMGIFYIALYTYVIGLGGIKSSVSGFGTDQFDQNDSKEKAQMTFFFDRFYIIINIGTILAVTVLVYIQDEVGRSWGYGICSAAMGLAVFTFLLGSKKYRYKKRTGSPLVQVLQVLVAAVRKRNAEYPSNASLLFEDSTPQGPRINHTDKFRCLDKAAIITSMDYGTNQSSAIQNPWRLCTVTKVEEVKMLVKLIPIWATTIMFWTVYAQMSSFSVQQALSMDTSVGNFKIPPGSYNVFLYGSIMLTLTVYDRLIVPNVNQPKKGIRGFTNLQKVGIGLFFSILGMISAAIAENKRLSVLARAKRLGISTSVLPIHAVILLPQYIFVGIGNGFIYAGQLDFFITQSPKGMKAIGTGFFLTTVSLGLFMSTILVDVVRRVTGGKGKRSWLAGRINDSRLDRFYWLLAILCTISLAFFIFCALRYKPNHDNSVQKTNGEVEIPDENRGEKINGVQIPEKEEKVQG